MNYYLEYLEIEAGVSRDVVTGVGGLAVQLRVSSPVKINVEAEDVLGLESVKMEVGRRNEDQVPADINNSSDLTMTGPSIEITYPSLMATPVPGIKTSPLASSDLQRSATSAWFSVDISRAVSEVFSIICCDFWQDLFDIFIVKRCER